MPISAYPGMGSRPYSGGVSFRVWAQFAPNVIVRGEFNGWSDAGDPLTSEGNGYWSTDVPGAAVGQRYKYVILDGANQLWRNDPYAELIYEDPQNGTRNTVIYDPGNTPDDGFRIANWNELIIYEMHLGTFTPPGTAPAGKFLEAATKLEYLQSLGVNAIELMPVGEFGTDPSWGYNPNYIFAVEDGYGGPDEFKQFVLAAHRRGIAVIFDVVYNHLGPDNLDLWQFDGWSQNNMGGIYFYEDWRAHTPWCDGRPDYGRGEVRQYLRDNALTWLERRYVDGLRWDSTVNIRNVKGWNNDPSDDIPDGWGLMQCINREIRTNAPGKISIAEDMQDNEWLTKDIGAGGAGFSAQWGANFLNNLRPALITSKDEERDMDAVRNALLGSYNGDAFQRVIYTESHDADSNGTERVPSKINNLQPWSWASEKRSTLGAALVFTAPGIPMLFQGQEFLESGWFDVNNPLDWSKLMTHTGIVQLYRDLIHLRRNWFNNTRGLRGQHVHVYPPNNTDKVIAFHRWDQGGPGDDVVIVANFSYRAYDSFTVGFPRPGLWRVRFNSDWSGYAPDFSNQVSYDTTANLGPRDEMPCSGNVGLGPYTAIILSQDN